jgi:hypothetical protein
MNFNLISSTCVKVNFSARKKIDVITWVKVKVPITDLKVQKRVEV